ncbi:4-hydroxybenzoate polyprenyl transferase [Botrytis cinerea]
MHTRDYSIIARYRENQSSFIVRHLLTSLLGMRMERYRRPRPRQTRRKMQTKTHGQRQALRVYPFTKRFMAYTPVFLGVTFGWGVFVGFAATGIDPLLPQLPFFNQAYDVIVFGALLLFLYYTIWTVIFETVYAFQDLPDDTKAGINSMAVRHQFHIRELLGALGVIQVITLLFVGKIVGAGTLYYFGPPLFNVFMLLRMVTSIIFGSSEQCRWWFAHGPLMVGTVMVVSVIIEYLGRIDQDLLA